MKKVKATVLKTFPNVSDMRDCIEGNIEPSEVKIHYKGEEYDVIEGFYNKTYFQVIEEPEHAIGACGSKIKYGDTCYFVGTNLNISYCKYSPLINSDLKIFSTKKHAEVELHSRIIVQCEDGEVRGEDKPIYCLLTKAQWQTDNHSSLSMWRNKFLENKKGLSDNWLLFKSEKNRDEYREQNMPKYSQKELDLEVNRARWVEQMKRPINVKNPYEDLTHYITPVC